VFLKANVLQLCSSKLGVETRKGGCGQLVTLTHACLTCKSAVHACALLPCKRANLDLLPRAPVSARFVFWGMLQGMLGLFLQILRDKCRQLHSHLANGGQLKLSKLLFNISTNPFLPQNFELAQRVLTPLATAILSQAGPDALSKHEQTRNLI
jgi:hypothetical protein